MPTRPPPRSDDKRGKSGQGSKAAPKKAAAPEKPAKKTKKKAEQLELL
jgi:hypothetical protein